MSRRRTRAWLTAALVVACCTPADAISLLYVDSGPLIEIVDVDAGASRKVIPLASGPSFGSQLSVSGGRVYVLNQAPSPFIAMPPLVVIDPERSAIVDSIEVVAPSGDPAVPDRRFTSLGFFGAGDDGSLFLLASELVPEVTFPFVSPAQFLVSIDPETRTVTAIPSPFQTSVPTDPSCFFSCSDQPPCLCAPSILAVAAPRGGRVWAIRGRSISLQEFPFSRTVDAVLFRIDLATGSVDSEVALGSLDSFFPQLLLGRDGDTAFVFGSGPSTTLVIVDLSTLQIARSVTFSEPSAFLLLAPDGLSLYDFLFSGEVRVLDVRPPFGLEPLRRFRLPAFGFAALSPDGTRLAQLAANPGRLGLSFRAVTVSASDGTILSDVALRSAGFSQLAFVDGCSTASCYCRADVDCGGNFCATGTCAGTEGCRYEDNPCFDGALCVLSTVATTTTTTLLVTTTTLPGFFEFPSCDRIFQRLGRLSEGVRERLVAGVSLQGTPAELRRAARRAERASRSAYERSCCSP